MSDLGQKENLKEKWILHFFKEKLKTWRKVEEKRYERFYDSVNEKPTPNFFLYAKGIIVKLKTYFPSLPTQGTHKWIKI